MFTNLDEIASFIYGLQRRLARVLDTPEYDQRDNSGSYWRKREMNFPIKKYVALCATLLIFATSLTGCGDDIKKVGGSGIPSSAHIMKGNEEFGKLAEPIFVTENGDRIGVNGTLTIADSAGGTVDTITTDDDTEFELVQLPLGNYTLRVDIDSCTHSDSGVTLVGCAVTGPNPIPFTVLAGTRIDVTIPIALSVADGGVDGPPVFSEGSVQIGAEFTTISVPGGCGNTCNDDTEACVRLIIGATIPDPLPAPECLPRCGGTFGACQAPGEECVFVAEQGDGPDEAFGVCEPAAPSS